MSRKNILKIFALCWFIISCNENDKFKCPYSTIEWNEKSNYLKNDNTKQFKVDLGGKLEELFKKNGKGDLSLEFDTEFKKISEDVSKSSLSYDKEFVQNWNALVTDICGKIEIINNKQLPDTLTNKLKISIFERVNQFYELTYIKNKKEENSEIKSIEHKPKISKDQQNNLIEISIQLPNQSKGYASVLVNGEKANLSISSTPYNPRVIIKGNNINSQTIKIITNFGDTCILDRVFDTLNSKESPIRYTPNCF